MVQLLSSFAALLSVLVVCTSAIPLEERSAPVSIPLTSVVKEGATAQDIVNSDSARKASFSNFIVGNAPATNEVVSYIAATTVGTQVFNLIVDTGSSNTWVGAGTAYVPGGTSTNTGRTFSVRYGSGQVQGREYTDSVTLGGVTATAQGVGVATSSNGFNGVDGIIGFGPVGLTAGTVSGQSTVPTFMQTLTTLTAIPANILGIYFKPETGSANNNINGALSLGAPDNTKYSGNIVYTPVTGTAPYSNYWGVQVTGTKYGTMSLQGSANAIVDTGTTLIYIPTVAYNKFLNVTGGKTDPTSGLAYWSTAPTSTFSFTIGGGLFTLTPSQYMIPPAQDGNLGLSTFRKWSYIADGGSDASKVNFILGQKFLENYYSVYDTAAHRVGLALRT